MERKINKKIDSYLTEFKDNITEKVAELGLLKDKNVGCILQYIYDYERLTLTKDDFTKKKRAKKVVNLTERCCAKRASGEQCTRRKKAECEYCGTHLKGTPHGICQVEEDNKPQGQKIEVWAQDIKGIMYYIDKYNNVYQAEDIIVNKINPKIIAKYVKKNDEYSIPEYNI